MLLANQRAKSFSCILLGINDHECFFQRHTKLRANAICSLRKNLRVLIFSKLHEKIYVITLLIIYIKIFQMVKEARKGFSLL